MLGEVAHRSDPKVPISAKLTFEEKYQNDCKCSGRRRFTKSMADINLVFAADRQMCNKYGSTDEGALRVRSICLWRVISVAKYARWR